MKKPRSDSILKTLPEARQEEVAEYLHEHSLSATRAWLAADGIKTSLAALSYFGAWHATLRQLAKNESAVEALIDNLKSENPDWTPQQLEGAGQAFFTALAIQQQDPKGWRDSQTIALKRDELNLSREKFEHLKAQADKADATEHVLDDAVLAGLELELLQRDRDRDGISDDDIVELNIGHAIVAQALFDAVRSYQMSLKGAAVLPSR